MIKQCDIDLGLENNCVLERECRKFVQFHGKQNLLMLVIVDEGKNGFLLLHIVLGRSAREGHD